MTQQNTTQITRLERTASKFDFGDEKSDITIHHEHGQTTMQGGYSDERKQAVVDACDELLGNSDEVEIDAELVYYGPADGGIDDHQPKEIA